MNNKRVNRRYCENTIMLNNEIYYLEKIWRIHKNDKTKDINGKIHPFPKHENTIGPEQNNIIERLKLINIYFETKKIYTMYDKPKNCLLCDDKNVSTKQYTYNNIIWDDGLLHYISKHNINPSIQFKQFIFGIDVIKNIPKMIISRVTKNDKEYAMIEKKQLLILDSFMIHGGYNKKYVDEDNKTVRYSEHLGYLEFENKTLSKIIVSGKTNNINETDDDIFMPSRHDDDMYKYAYMFHTHPPTPRPGGRAIDGILYEYPSIGDIYHFIEHHNSGCLVGSLIIAAEGLYNIRSLVNNISIDEDKLYKEYDIIFSKMQKKAIKKYGTTFNTYTFYSKIAQETCYIDKINIILNKYNIHIDYYSRKKTINNNWVLDTIFLIL